MLVRPLPRVNLKHGLPEDGRTTTCTAGAGSLLLEFLLLSRLTGTGTVPVYRYSCTGPVQLDLKPDPVPVLRVSTYV